MAPPYLLTALAISDLNEIWEYIARDSREAADRVETAIFPACTDLADNPPMGSRRPELKRVPRLRFWTVSRYPDYLIAYYPDTKPLRIAAILHGKRDLRRVFSKRDSP